MRLEQRSSNLTGGPLRVRSSPWGNGPDPGVWKLNVQLVTPASFSWGSQDDDDFIDTAW